jgi:hypothetical protein
VPSFVANAQQRASKPEVKARVKELLERAAEKVCIDLAWLTERLVEVAGADQDGMEIKTSDKLRALELLAKVKGFKVSLPEAEPPREPRPPKTFSSGIRIR